MCLCVHFFVVCFGREHLASKRLSEQSDERGVCGHAFNELRTRPELKEREGGRYEKREGAGDGGRGRFDSQENLFGFLVSVPGRAQSTLAAVST